MPCPLNYGQAKTSVKLIRTQTADVRVLIWQCNSSGVPWFVPALGVSRKTCKKPLKKIDTYCALSSLRVQQIWLFSGAKLAVGISTGSLAIIGDAIHSFTDVLNNGVAWLVVKHSSAPPDAEHPYGHRKFETLAVFGLATLLAVFAFELALQAIRREDSVVTTGGWELLLMLAVLVINVVLSAWQRFWGPKTKLRHFTRRRQPYVR